MEHFSHFQLCINLISGLGTISIGSIIFFVGTGEKGFKTQELRLIGPALAGESLNIHQVNLNMSIIYQ